MLGMARSQPELSLVIGAGTMILRDLRQAIRQREMREAKPKRRGALGHRSVHRQLHRFVPSHTRALRLEDGQENEDKMQHSRPFSKTRQTPPAQLNLTPRTLSEHQLPASSQSRIALIQSKLEQKTHLSISSLDLFTPLDQTLAKPKYPTQ